MDIQISIIVSVYNEEEVLNAFHKEASSVLNKLGKSYELIFVNDGSVDSSRELLSEIAKADKNTKVINFSRNYGHEAAMLAGLDHSKGNCVICMDADLQHPPAVIPQMVEKYESGVDILTMVRTKNPDSGFFKSITSKLFYSILNRISGQKFDINASDFFLVSKRVAKILRTEFREQSRFLRGFIQIVGFNRGYLEYEANQRLAGESKYSIRNLFKYSFNVMLTFSNLPLRLGVSLGILVGLFGLFIAVWEIIMKFKGLTPPGYTTIVVLISFLFAMMFVLIGVIGEYIAVLFKEVKARPIYIIEEILNEDS
ncbi:glycosyltransferase family 2 protein [Fulvivirga lutea]|uniref:Glycosyltransferase family 2 protein n=1 Tax=Fulvivirga lutea TaxID=2810512 RepID=A0A974WH76_9BACT|nr:glycosyltransferase family 2 protein [Fulvivirga lutea]QSE97819.1 glycosyltransferase family 2 protein [Fulvivirga lutea]